MVKIPLKMPDGAEVRTIGQLRDHFDLGAVLEYYSNGKLTKWLEDRYYTEEAEKISVLDSSSKDFILNLCNILDVNNEAGNETELDLDDIERKNKRREFLKCYTASDIILEEIDMVAFDQKELQRLLDDGIKKIYLCSKNEEKFYIPGDIEGITYIGINYPDVELIGEKIEAGIDLQCVKFNIDSYCNDGEQRFYSSFEKNPHLGIKLLREAVENGSATAQITLGICYKDGFGVEINAMEAVKCYKKAAMQGDANAQNLLGHCYRYGLGVEKCAEKTVEWTQKAAMQGNVNAQTRLGICYENGYGIEKNKEEAVVWYRKAAEQEDSMAQYYLGRCYKEGHGVGKDKQEAIKWLMKSFNQRNEKAKSDLIEIAPWLFKISEVILYAIGGKENQNSFIMPILDKAESRIVIELDDLRLINTAVLTEFGAKSVWVEKALTMPSPKKKLFGNKVIDNTLWLANPEAYILKKGIEKGIKKGLEILSKPEKDMSGLFVEPGRIYIEFDKITPEMENDFLMNIKV